METSAEEERLQHSGKRMLLSQYPPEEQCHEQVNLDQSAYAVSHQLLNLELVNGHISCLLESPCITMSLGQFGSFASQAH